MFEPVKKTIEVPCTQEQAFKTFVSEVTSWWPLDKNSVSAMSGEVAKQITIEEKMGGRVFEIGHDDCEHLWGSVTEYRPHELVTIDWHIGLPPENASEVSVGFTKIDDKKTRVELSHSRWEAFGDKAEAMRSGYDQGWVGVFETAFNKACGG